MKTIWASTHNFGMYHIASNEGSSELVHMCNVARDVQSMDEEGGSDQNLDV